MPVSLDLGSGPIEWFHPLTIHTLLLYSPVEFDSGLAKKALKSSLKYSTPGLKSVA